MSWLSLLWFCPAVSRPGSVQRQLSSQWAHNICKCICACLFGILRTRVSSCVLNLHLCDTSSHHTTHNVQQTRCCCVALRRPTGVAAAINPPASAGSEDFDVLLLCTAVLSSCSGCCVQQQQQKGHSMGGQQTAAYRHIVLCLHNSITSSSNPSCRHNYVDMCTQQSSDQIVLLGDSRVLHITTMLSHKPAWAACLLCKHNGA